MKKFYLMKIIVLLIILSICLTGCFGKNTEEVNNSINEFEYACQNMDVRAILDSIDPDISDPIRLAFALYSGATGQDYEDFIDGIVDTIVGQVFGTTVQPRSFLSSLEISDTKCSVKKSSASVGCHINFEIAGEKFKREAIINLIKQDDKWYIVNFDVDLPYIK
ncbi:hypothetical protein P261_00345 [Lachnospiraceae bacterium TWA4]|nr:hypothetical protein P261_00345 [Lachnospiraceae bacterium TWA4]